MPVPPEKPLTNGQERADIPTWQWRQLLLQMQTNAPLPIALVCDLPVDPIPPMYSTEYFGKIKTAAVATLLVKNGNYLVRQKGDVTQYYVLSFRFCEKVLNFKLYYSVSTSMHYVGSTKLFGSLYDLVADGLATYYLEMLTAMFLDGEIAKSPYMIKHKMKLEAMAKVLQNNLLTGRYPCSGYTGHNFKVTSLKGLNWCTVCACFMWGFMSLQQSYKCSACGYLSHQKCLKKIQDNDCPGCIQNSIVDMNACFGVDLSQLGLGHGRNVPWLVTKSIKEIENRGGLESEGLYRVSGFQEELDALKARIDREGTVVDLSSSAYENINVITGILKLYFRLLPVPLITQNAYDALVSGNVPEIGGGSFGVEAVKGMRNSLTILPEAHYYTLKYLAAHLHRVSCHHEHNKMGVHNLATVFCPSLMPLPAVTEGRVPDMSKGIEALALIISYHETVFIH